MYALSILLNGILYFSGIFILLLNAFLLRLYLKNTVCIYREEKLME